MLNVKVDLVRNLGAFSSFRSLAKEEESGGQDDHQRDQGPLNVGHVEGHGRGKLDGQDIKQQQRCCVQQGMRRTDRHVKRSGTIETGKVRVAELFFTVSWHRPETGGWRARRAL
jgi:hypothetical protein